MPLMQHWGHLVAGCAWRLYIMVCFTSNSAFQACTAESLPGDLTCSLFLFHCWACFGAGGWGKLGWNYWIEYTFFNRSPVSASHSCPAALCQLSPGLLIGTNNPQFWIVTPRLFSFPACISTLHHVSGSQHFQPLLPESNTCWDHQQEGRTGTRLGWGVGDLGTGFPIMSADKKCDQNPHTLMFSRVFSGLRPWHVWEFISFTLRETDSVMKAERALPVLRAGGKVPTRAACTLLLPLAMPAASASSTPCPSYLAPDCADLKNTLCVLSELQALSQCYPILLQLSPLVWASHTLLQISSSASSVQSLASYLCNHLLATGRNLVLHCSFPQWGSPFSCGYGFANQFCLWLARVCAVLQLMLLSAKRASTWGLGGKSWF